MQINRHNYEEFLLLYVDNELTAAQRAAIEAFVQENPDIADELSMLLDTVLQPEEKMEFGSKHHLFREEHGINVQNCESYFLLYVDNELSTLEKKEVEKFVLQHPALQPAFVLLQQTKLQPETVICPSKSALLHYEEKRVIPLYIKRMTIAAVFFAVMALVYFVIPSAKNDQLVSSPGVQQPLPPAPATKDEQIQPPQQKTQVVEQQPAIVSKQPSKKENPAIVPVLKKVEQKSVLPQQVATKEKSNKDVVPSNNLPERLSEAELAALNINVIPQEDNTAKLPGRRTLPANAINEEKGPITIAKAKPVNEAINIKQAIYREANTFDEEENTLLVGSARLNKNKLRGLLKKATGFIERRIDRNDSENNF